MLPTNSPPIRLPSNAPTPPLGSAGPPVLIPLNDTDLPPVQPSIPGYVLIRELGRGGFGVVYEARDLALDRIVAVKVLLASRRIDPDGETRFRLEAQAAARLRHPNIVQVHEFAEGPIPYVVMEYIAGPTLDDFVDDPQDPRWSAAVLAAVARGIHHAHEHGILHRDIKPANVLLNAECGMRNAESGPDPRGSGLDSAFRIPHSAFTPKVTDFGLAKLLTDDPRLTASGNVTGTPGYMAPEQLGTGAAIGPWSDVFSLGVVLYELLTGRQPFPGTLMADIAYQIMYADPTAPRRVWPSVPRDLEAVCLKCLEKDPRRRYASAAALADDLERWLRGEPVTARAQGPIGRAWKLARRHPTVAALTVGLVLALVGGFAATTALYLQTEAARKDEAVARTAAESAATDARAAEAKTAAAMVELEALNAFLMRDILAVPRPRAFQTGGLGPTITMKEALDAAAAKIETRFKDTPRVAAAADMAVGETYRQLGDYPAALRHLRRAVSTWEEHPPADPSRLTSARRLLGITLSRVGKTDEAAELFRRVVVDADTGSDAKFAAQARRELGLCLIRMNKPDEAIEWLQAAYDVIARVGGPDSTDALGMLVGIASAHLKAGRPDRAAQIATDAAARAESAHGSESLSVAYALGVLGSARVAQNDLATAEGPLRRAADIHAALVGANHPDSLVQLVLHARVLLRLERYSEAEVRLRSAAAAAPTALGAADPWAVEIRTMYAKCLRETGAGAAVAPPPRVVR